MVEARKQFTFYESFFKAVSRIRNSEDRASAYDAICAYALYGEEPNMDTLPDTAAIAFDLIKPNLDSSRKKAENGKKGGEKKQVASKPEAKRKQVASEKENEYENEYEYKKENECYIATPPKKTKSVRHQYGEYKKVLLTDEELDKLKAEFPDWQSRIERLDSYIAQSGKSYKNHLATIRNWARKDSEGGKTGGGSTKSFGENEVFGTYL